MSNDLDTRARAAAKALHESVRALPVASFERPTTAPHRGRILLIAAAAIAVVGLAVSLDDDGPGEAGLATDASGGAPRLVIDDPPAGMAVSGAFDLPSPSGLIAGGTHWVYGDAGADDPFAARDLALVEFGADGVGSAPTEGSERADVNGHPAWVSTAPDDLGRRSVYVELDGTTLGLLSATLDDDALLALASSLDLDAATLAPPDVLDGLELVGTATGDISELVMLPFPTSAGHLVAYSSEADDGSQSIRVVSVESGEGTLPVARWWLGASARPVEVRGLDGWSGSPDGGASTMVLWQESPTVLVAVMGIGAEEDALLSAAESLRAATDDEWADLLTASRTVSVPRDSLAGVSSDGTDGSAFAAYVDADGSLCLEHGTAAGSVASCSSGGSLDLGTQRLGSGDIVLYGHTALGTDGELRIEAGDGSLSMSEAYHDEGTVFAAVFTDDTLPAEIVVRGPDGTELARAIVGDPGTGGTSSFGGQGTPVTP